MWTQAILESLTDDGVLIADAVRVQPADVRARFRRLFGTNDAQEAARLVAAGVAQETDRNIQRVLPSALITGGESSILAFRQRNVGLISTLGEELLEDVQETLTSRAFEHPSTLRHALQERFDVGAARAELWARDQTLKLAGDIQQARQSGAGITHYIWRTSGDERVRERHSDLNGTTQSWAEPPVVDPRTDRRAHPGGDYQCRCTAEPVLPD